jgi:hypothetical protein
LSVAPVAAPAPHGDASVPNFLPAGAVVVVAAAVVGVVTAAVGAVVAALLEAVLEPVVAVAVVAALLGVVVAAVDALEALWPLPHAAAASPNAIRSASVRVLVRRALRRVSYRLVMWSPRTVRAVTMTAYVGELVNLQ